MKKFLKKYGYILLAVVIVAGCYTGFRAFRYWYLDTADQSGRGYHSIEKVKKKCGREDLLHLEDYYDWSTIWYALYYPKGEPENPNEITGFYNWRKENPTVYGIEFPKDGLTIEEYMGRHHTEPIAGGYLDTDVWTDFPVTVYYEVTVYSHTYDPSGYAFFEYGGAYYRIHVSSRQEARAICTALFASAGG